MRILIISSTESGIGGKSHHIQGLKKYLKKNNHFVEIISSDNTPIIPIHNLKNPSFMITSFFKSRFKRNFDIIHAHDLPSALSMRNFSGKKILTFHGILSKQIDLTHGKILTKISEKYEKKAIKWADAITAISKESYEFYKSKSLKTYHIPNGIDIESLEKKIDRRFEKQIIFAGRFSKEKGIFTLLEIAKKLPKDLNLVIIGSGPEEPKIKKISDEINNVHFLGLKNKDETISLIRGSDVLIQPSLVEGISSTLLESMACKTSIVASDIPGIREVLENSKTGILVSPQEANSFVKEIVGLFQDNKKQELLSNNSFAEVLKYNWKNIGKLYLDVYENLISQDTIHQNRKDF
jgi:glycosyltransferase involved in cell wall biosynthesis